MISCTPDSDDLTRVKVDAIHLSNEDGCYSLVQGGAVHVHGGSYWQHKAGNTHINPVVLLQATEGDGQGGSTGQGKKMTQL